MSIKQTISNTAVQDVELVRKLQNAHQERQLERVVSFLPDKVLSLDNLASSSSNSAVVILLIEVNGLSRLYQQYNKMSNGGKHGLTSTLNAYTGCLIEIVHFHGGDVLKFAPWEILACWNVGINPTRALQRAINCALYSRKILNGFKTEINVVLKLKFTLAHGDVKCTIIGTANRSYVIHGATIDDVKLARSMGTWGDVHLTSNAFQYLDSRDYVYSVVTDGIVKVTDCIRSNEYNEGVEENMTSLNEICEKHMNYRAEVHRQKTFTETSQDAETFEKYKQSLPPRECARNALKNSSLHNLKPFVLKLIRNKLDVKNPWDMFNEIREVAVQYINIATASCVERSVIEDVYIIVQGFTCKCRGLSIDVSAMDGTIAVFSVFGLGGGSKTDNDCKNALVAGHNIFNEISHLRAVKMVSVSVTHGFAYCGVIGHPQRKSFVVIGEVATRAVKLTRKLLKKIICDYNTYKNSKLSSQSFKLIKSSNGDIVFEYNQKVATGNNYVSNVVIGREEERDIIYGIVNHPEKFNYYGICFNGRSKQGKSKLIQWCYTDMLEEGYPIASLELCQCTQRPYYCISNIYKQLCNAKNKADSEDYIFIEELPAELWNFSEILQNRNSLQVEIKLKVLSLFREIVKHSPYGFTVIFVDNVQYVDNHSLDILETVIAEGCIRFVCAGEFEERFWNVRWKMSLDNYIKLLELGPIKSNSIARFACSYLHAHGIHERLIDVLENNCGASPGIMEKFIQELNLKGYLELIHLEKKEIDAYILVEDKMLTPQSTGVRFKEDFNMTEILTPYTITMNTISQLTTFQLSLVKTCVFIGEIIYRSLLVDLCQFRTSDNTLADALSQLFCMNVFECAAQHLNLTGLKLRSNVCYCSPNENERSTTTSRSSKAGLCKVLHFKDSSVRDIVYNLMDDNTKQRMHCRIMEFVENQNNSCLNCKQNHLAPIMTLPKFSSITSAWDDSCEMKTTTECKNFAKIWDSSICSCLEILLQVYSELIDHSKKANCIEREIFYIVQYAKIVLLTNEFERAVSLLVEALKLCDSSKENDILVHFKEIHLTEINLLVAKSFLYIGNDYLAKRYLLKTIRVFITDAEIFKKIFNSKITSGRSTIKMKMIENNFASCLDLIISILILEKDYEMAKLACDEILLFSRNVDVDIISNIYSNAIMLYSYLGERQNCWILEKLIRKSILKPFTGRSLHEFFSIMKVMTVLFHERLLNGRLGGAIRLGYRLLDLNVNCHANYILVDVAFNLACALVVVKRIEDSVEVAKVLCTKGSNFDERGSLAYNVFAMKLILEASFILEPFESVLSFSSNYFDIKKNCDYTTMEKTLLLYLFNYHLRNNRWSESCIWKKYINFSEFSCFSIQSATNLFKYTESILISFVQNESTTRHEDIKTAKKYLKKCKAVGHRWSFFLTRYYHLKSYFLSATNKKHKMKKFLEKAFESARGSENVLEYCWLMQSCNCREEASSFESDKKCIDWKLAKSFAPMNWSHILYGLPCNT